MMVVTRSCDGGHFAGRGVLPIDFGTDWDFLHRRKLDEPRHQPSCRRKTRYGPSNHVHAVPYAGDSCDQARTEILANLKVLEDAIRDCSR